MEITVLNGKKEVRGYLLPPRVEQLFESLSEYFNINLETLKVEVQLAEKVKTKKTPVGVLRRQILGTAFTNNTIRIYPRQQGLFLLYATVLHEAGHIHHEQSFPTEFYGSGSELREKRADQFALEGLEYFRNRLFREDEYKAVLDAIHAFDAHNTNAAENLKRQSVTLNELQQLMAA